MTCNLAYWHHLIVSMEIEKSYAILWNIPDRESLDCAAMDVARHTLAAPPCALLPPPGSWSPRIWFDTGLACRESCLGGVGGGGTVRIQPGLLAMCVCLFCHVSALPLYSIFLPASAHLLLTSNCQVYLAVSRCLWRRGILAVFCRILSFLCSCIVDLVNKPVYFYPSLICWGFL
ncbi:hypothetical protein Q7C36_021696 [Tachysurus vachellii]|uniref:Uncharacterized protein n=1 Tax=Tachysurus vachellii TaxID=175792 RepID=A0AA88LHT3_TACVA|nr:hypothetical protein Q7C36_021696 [Tachysurus vachellii]